MSNRRTLPRPQIARECYEVAADWVQVISCPDASDAELQGWIEWVNASDQNRAAFEEMQALYCKLSALPLEFRRQARRNAAHTQRIRRVTRLLTRTPSVWAAVAAIAICGVVIWHVWPETMISETYIAPPAHHRTVTLPDHSMVALGPDAIVTSRLTRGLYYLSVERGQVYFDVHHDPRRQFVVQSDTVRITDIGTSFQVIRGADRVAIAVIEGVIDVTQSNGQGAAAQVPKALQIRAGERLVMKSANAVDSPAEPLVPTESKWKNGQIEFINASLSEVIAAVNRRSTRALTIEDPRVADLRYTGSILADDLTEWASSLSSIYPVRAVPMGDGSLALILNRSAVVSPQNPRPTSY